MKFKMKKRDDRSEKQPVRDTEKGLFAANSDSLLNDKRDFLCFLLSNHRSRGFSNCSII